MQFERQFLAIEDTENTEENEINSVEAEDAKGEGKVHKELPEQRSCEYNRRMRLRGLSGSTPPGSSIYIFWFFSLSSVSSVAKELERAVSRLRSK
jgi:hypothetical protein